MSAAQSTATKKKASKVLHTALTDVMSFPADHAAMKAELKKRLVIGAPVFGKAPNDDNITFHRLQLTIMNPDDTEGNLVVDFDRSFSFGTSENKIKNKLPDGTEFEVLRGYGTSISLYDRDGASERQSRTVQFIEVLAEVIKEHLLQEEVKDALGQPELNIVELKKINPIYYRKDEKKKVIPNAGGTLYPKLNWFPAGKNKKSGKEQAAVMRTVYRHEDEVDEKGEQLVVDPLDYLGVTHYITPAVHFQSVFFSEKTKNLQISVYEADVKAAETGQKRLLKVQPARAQAVIINGVNPLLARKKETKEEKQDDATAPPKSSGKAESVPSAPAKEAEDAPLTASGDEAEDDDDEAKAAKAKAKEKKLIKKKVPKAGKDKEAK